MISREVANFTLTIGNETVTNRFLWHAENTFPRLQEIYDDKSKFFCDAYSLLANTFERFYKGVSVELAKLYPEVYLPDTIDNVHPFTAYAQIVNKYIPIAKSTEGYFVTLDNLKRIQKGYNDAKFYDQYEYSDFEKDFRRLTLQRDRIYAGLEQLIIQNRCKDVMHADDIAHEDLDLE